MSRASIPGRGILGNPVIAGLVFTLAGGGLGVFAASGIVAHSTMGNLDAVGITILLLALGMSVGLMFTWLLFRKSPRRPPF